MKTEVTVTLSPEVKRRAESLAKREGTPLAEFLAGFLESSLRPLGPVRDEADNELPITEWTDQDVLAAADAMLSERDDERLSELLERQQNELLTGPERGELAGLMEIYQQGLLRKAEALCEAVRRGLREPLNT